MTRICKRSLRVLSLLRAACFHLCRNGKKLGNGMRMMVVCQEILRASDWKEKVKANILRISVFKIWGNPVRAASLFIIKKVSWSAILRVGKYWGQPERKKRPQVSFETSSQWDYVNRLPTDLSAFWVPWHRKRKILQAILISIFPLSLFLFYSRTYLSTMIHTQKVIVTL